MQKKIDLTALEDVPDDMLRAWADAGIMPVSRYIEITRERILLDRKDNDDADAAVLGILVAIAIFFAAIIGLGFAIGTVKTLVFLLGIIPVLMIIAYLVRR